MIDVTTPEIQFALRATQQAALLIQRIQAQTVTQALTKDDRSPVTMADFAAQALVGSLLAEAFPADPLVGEEGADSLRSAETAPLLEQITHFVADFIPRVTPPAVLDWIDSGKAAPARRFWTLDPLDGTKGYLRGDQYVVALAFLLENQVQIGVLGCPRLSLPQAGLLNGCLVLAVRGQGSWAAPLENPAQFQRLQVSAISDPTQARLLRSFESGHTNVDQIEQFSRALAIQAQPLRLDSQAKYALLASGSGEIMLRMISAKQPDYREKIWDQAAGSIVIEEAGGKVTDLDGRNLDFSAGRTLAHNRGVLATNASLHAAALECVKRIQA